MNKRGFQILVISVCVGLIVYTSIKIFIFSKDPYSEIDTIVIAFITGIISGFLGNRLFLQFQRENRLRRITENLKHYVGSYNVYHWRDLLNSDGCNYRVKITLDTENSILKIHQTGSESVHELFADIKMNENTFNYGEGNYSHPQKRGNPVGRIQLYLIGNGTINVDKYYLDDEGQRPGFEKWQWRKI